MKSRFFVFALIFVVGGAVGGLASFSYFSSREEVLEDEVFEEPVEGVDSEEVVSGKGRFVDDASFLGAEVGRDFSERVALAMSHGSYRRRQYELERLFETLSAESAPDVLAEILDVKEPRLRGDLMRPFFVKWGELDGPAAYASAIELKGRNRSDGISGALAGWAHTDVHASWEVALELIENSTRAEAQLARGAVSEMAKQDPDTLLRLLAGDSFNQKYSSFGYVLVNEAFEDDRQSELLPKLGLIENEMMRNQLVSQVFQKWGTLDTEAPLDALAGLKDPEQAKSALEGFLKGWVESDREGALDYAFDNQGDPVVKGTFASMVQQSVRDGNLEDNEELVDRLESSGLLAELAPKIGRSMALMYPEIGIRIADSIADPKERDRQRQHAVSQLAQADFEKAKDYVDGLESVEEKAKLLPSVSWALVSRNDGGSELVSLVESIPAGQDRTKVIEDLLVNATRQNVRTSESYKEGLATLVEGEGELSSKARDAWKKLAEPAP